MTSPFFTLPHRSRGAFVTALLHPHSIRRSVLASLCLTQLLPAIAAGAEWTAGEASWFTPGNWTPAGAPVAGQQTTIANGGTARVSNTGINGTALAGQLRIGTGSGTTGHLLATDGGTLAVSQILVGDGALGGGSLTVADDALVTVSNGFGGIQLGTHGTVRFGTGGAPGRIAADGITGMADGGTIIFDHNHSNFVLTHDIHFNGNVFPGFLRLFGNLDIVHNAGVTVLKSQSYFQGTTTINGGRFVVDGVISGETNWNNTMQVNAQGTLGGSGSYYGRVIANPGGRIAPGDAGAGTGLLAAKHFHFYGGSTWEIDIANAGGAPGAGWDALSGQQIAFYGTPGTAPIRLTLRSLSGGVPGPAVDFGGSRKWAIAKAVVADDGLPGEFVSFDPAEFVLDTTQFANALHDGTFSLELSHNAAGERVLNLVYERPVIDAMLPGDPVAGTSSNSPGGEFPAMGTDNSVVTKYLNFDKLNAGLILHPAGTAPVIGLSLISANDAPERDPASFLLEGSRDGILFTPIAAGNVPPFAARRAIQTVRFANSHSYPVYRLTFPSVQNAATANSVQIAEVELLTCDEITSVADPVSLTVPSGDAAGNSPALVDHRLSGNHSSDDAKFWIDFFQGQTAPVLDITPASGASILKGFQLIRPADDNAYTRRIAPGSITVQGSNDGISFTTLTVVTPDSPRSDLRMEDFSTPENQTSFTRYRFIFHRPGGEGVVQFGELRLFGHTGPDLTPQGLWRRTHFGTGTATGNAAPTADPDNDGRSNLLEFGTDRNPNSGSDDGKVMHRDIEIGGQNLLSITLPVRNGAVFQGTGEQVSLPVDGIIYRIQGSTDLANWTSTPVTRISSARSEGLPALNPGWQYQTFSLPNPGPRGFLRAVIEMAP